MPPRNEYYKPGNAVHGLGEVLCGAVATTKRWALEKVNLEAHSWPNKTGRRGWGTKKKGAEPCAQEK